MVIVVPSAISPLFGFAFSSFFKNEISLVRRFKSRDKPFRRPVKNLSAPLTHGAVECTRILECGWTAEIYLHSSTWSSLELECQEGTHSLLLISSSPRVLEEQTRTELF